MEPIKLKLSIGIIDRILEGVDLGILVLLFEIFLYIAVSAAIIRVSISIFNSTLKIYTIFQDFRLKKLEVIKNKEDIENVNVQNSQSILQAELLRAQIDLTNAQTERESAEKEIAQRKADNSL